MVLVALPPPSSLSHLPCPPQEPNPLTHTPSPSIVVSVFAIIILSVLGALFNANHHSLMDGTEDPASGPVVAGTAFGAVGVYGVRALLLSSICSLSRSLPYCGVASTGELRGCATNANTYQFFLVFCGMQAWLHARERRRGAIALS